jgi:hypothetical protein
VRYNIGQFIKITSEPYQREYLFGKLAIIVQEISGMGGPIYEILVQGYPNKSYYVQEEDLSDKL